MDYERYTLSTRGYPCHYDKSDNSCAWCLPGSQQCGKARTWANRYLDKNRRMKNKWKKENTCLPVVNTDRKSYAKRPWVVCIGQGNRLLSQYNYIHYTIKSNIVIFIGKQIIHTFIILVQDCNRQGNECDENAECVDTGVKKQIARGKVWKVHRCACKTGFVGNGITCADENTGNQIL